MMRPLLRWVTMAGGAFLALLFAFATWDAWRGPPLEPWHRERTHDVRAPQVDQLDWDGYLAAEEAVFEEVRQEVTVDLPKRDQVPFNRYYDRSPVHPANFARDWNHSFVLEPGGAAVGAAVMLHGLTDSPYSLHALAEHFAAQGLHVVALRLPGHGTAPAGLLRFEVEDMQAAVQLAMRDLRARLGSAVPIYMVGYSNGAALAVDYTLDVLEHGDAVLPAGLVLISPLLMALAVAVRLWGGPGPIFYTQERVGLDGRPFHLIKFRSMREDAEQATGPVWASPDDRRRTKIGTTGGRSARTSASARSNEGTSTTSRPATVCTRSVGSSPPIWAQPPGVTSVTITPA